MDQPILYATPVHRPPSMWAAAVLAFVGLGLIGLGGCFLIGVLAFHIPQVFISGATIPTWTFRMLIFVLILYLLATLCIVSGLFILTRVTKTLFIHLRGE